MVYLYVMFLTRKILRMWSAKDHQSHNCNENGVANGVANGTSSLILSVLILAFSSF